MAAISRTRYVLMAWMCLCPAWAQATEQLAKENGCLNCHAVDRKVMGPAYHDVAVKYRGDADAPARLEAKVRQGGRGVWGPAPMPGQTRVSDDDLKAIISWVLAQ